MAEYTTVSPTGLYPKAFVEVTHPGSVESDLQKGVGGFRLCCFWFSLGQANVFLVG